MNKYEQIPDQTIDFHGYTTTEAERELNVLLKNTAHTHIRIITGTGVSRGGAPVLREYIKNICQDAIFVLIGLSRSMVEMVCLKYF